MRKRMTKAEVDAALNRMAGSYTLAAQPFAQPGGGLLTGSALATSSSVSPVDRLLPSALRSPSTDRPGLPEAGSRAEQSVSLGESSRRTASQTASTRDVGFVTRLGSSVKSSSPLAQAPIQASPMDPHVALPASSFGRHAETDRVARADPQAESFGLPTEPALRHASERALPLNTNNRHVQSLPGNSYGVGLSRNHSLPPPLPTSSANENDASMPILVDSDRDSRRRAPVLQRGGFNQLMSQSRDKTSGPATGISSVSVGGSADQGIGITSPPRKFSRSVPARDLLASPRALGQPLPLHNTAGTESTRDSPGSGNLLLVHGALRDERTSGRAESVSRPSSRSDRAAANHPRLARALSGGPEIGRVASSDGQEYALRDPSRTAAGSRDRTYRASVDTSQQPSLTAPASFDERRRAATYAEPTGRRWASDDDRYQHYANDGRRDQPDNDDNEDSVVGDLEMSDCHR